MLKSFHQGDLRKKQEVCLFIKNILIFTWLIIVFSCNSVNIEENTWKTEVPIISELPSISLTQKEYNETKPILVNSKEQMKNQLADSLYHIHTEYSLVDFSKYSVLLNYTKSTHRIITTTNDIYLDKTHIPYLLTIFTNSILEDKKINNTQYYIEGFIINKLDIKIETQSIKTVTFD